MARVISLLMSAALMAPAQTSPIYLLTSRGVRQNGWMRDAAPGSLKLYRLKEPAGAGERPANLGLNVSDFRFEASRDRDSARDLIGGAMNAGGGRDGLLVLYVHGYNSSVRDAVDTVWRIRRQFEERGIRAAYAAVSWPSDKRPERYNQDLSDARAFAKPLGAFLKELAVSRPHRGLRIVMATHSMGAQPITRAAAFFTYETAMLDELSLVASDLDRSDLDKDKFGQYMPRLARRTTAYFTDQDLALGGSGLFRGYTGGRLGSLGPVQYEDLPSAVTFVNASRDVKAGRNPLSGLAATHSIYWENETFMNDLASLFADRPFAAGTREVMFGRHYRLRRPEN